jgi:hypothetical protein
VDLPATSTSDPIQDASANLPSQGRPSVAFYTYKVRSVARVILPAPSGSVILTAS